MAYLVRECCALYFKPTFQSEYWVEHKAMPRVKAPMMTTRAIIFHTHCEWMDSCGGREREREVQSERKGRAEVSEFNEICGFLWLFKTGKEPHITYITNHTNDDIMLYVIYSVSERLVKHFLFWFSSFNANAFIKYNISISLNWNFSANLIFWENGH